tara:strand:- start:67402 stop:68739 length:1338 start_codon:yes stop_codon:yes gene_type:complete
MVFLSNYNFYVDTDDVNFLEDLEGIYHSYTFPIYKLNNEESHLIQNMLFSFNTVNNDYDTFIITYSLTENERENLANSIHVDLDDKVSIEFLSDFNPDIILDPLTVIIDVDEGSVTCWEEEYGSSQGTGWEEIVGWDQVTCPWLIDPGTGGGNGAGPTSPGGNTGSNPPGNTGNPNNTSNGPNTIPDNPFTYSNVNTAASQRSKTFYRMQLNPEQRAWYSSQPPEIKDAIGDFLESQINIDGFNSAATQYPQEDVDYVIGIINSGIDGSLVSASPFVKYPNDLSTQYKQQYPKLTAYLSMELPELSNDNLIINALNQYGSLNNEQINNALKWGNDSSVTIMIIDMPCCWGAYGPQFGYDENIILLSTELAAELESNSTISEDALNFFVGIVILHEVTHLGDYLYNGDMYDGEEGNDFELDVIGDYMLNPNNSSEYYQGYKLKKRN